MAAELHYPGFSVKFNCWSLPSGSPAELSSSCYPKQKAKSLFLRWSKGIFHKWLPLMKQRKLRENEWKECDQDRNPDWREEAYLYKKKKKMKHNSLIDSQVSLTCCLFSPPSTSQFNLWINFLLSLFFSPFTDNWFSFIVHNTANPQILCAYSLEALSHFMFILPMNKVPHQGLILPSFS